MSYERDLAWSRSQTNEFFEDLRKKGYLVASPKDFDEKAGIDAVVIGENKKLFSYALRSRRREVVRDEHLCDLTIRFSRPSGVLTEWQKIIEQGNADLYYHEVADESKEKAKIWHIIDLHALRKFMHEEPKQWNSLWSSPIQNKDGTSFRAINLQKIPFKYHCVLDSSEPFFERPASSTEMKYFLSGASGIRANVLPDVAACINYRLLSMHKAFKGNTRVWCAISHHRRSAMKEVMLDSGAFTAFMKGHKLALQDLIAVYDDTIRKLNPKLKVWLINLDVIPGEMGRVSTPTEIADALDASDKNFKILRNRYSDMVLPVYHQTEGEKRLMHVASMSDYIALGFRQDFAESHRIQHAQEAIALVAPLGKRVHGLATTGYTMLARAPFDSVDSATWLYIAAMGGIMYIDDMGEITSIAVSSSSPRQRVLRDHYSTLDPAEQLLIAQHMKSAGVTLEQLQGDLSYRILFNASQMREWMGNYRKPHATVEHGLFPI